MSRNPQLNLREFKIVRAAGVFIELLWMPTELKSAQKSNQNKRMMELCMVSITRLKN